MKKHFAIIAMLTLGSSLAIANEQSNDAFWTAAKSGNVEALEKSLASGVPIDVKNEDGYTALIYATYYGHEDAMKFLLKNKADPCIGDKKGNTAFFGALFKGFDSLALKLMPLCGIDQTNKQGQTPLMYASLFGRTEMAKVLLKAGADPRKKDLAGYDAIGLAEGQWNQIMVKLLKATSIIK